MSETIRQEYSMKNKSWLLIIVILLAGCQSQSIKTGKSIPDNLRDNSIGLLPCTITVLGKKAAYEILDWKLLALMSENKYNVISYLEIPDLDKNKVKSSIDSILGSKVDPEVLFEDKNNYLLYNEKIKNYFASDYMILPIIFIYNDNYTGKHGYLCTFFCFSNNTGETAFINSKNWYGDNVIKDSKAFIDMYLTEDFPSQILAGINGNIREIAEYYGYTDIYKIYWEKPYDIIPY